MNTSSESQQKAEQYLKDAISRYRSKLTDDCGCGTDPKGESRHKKYLKIMEDIWLPRTHAVKEN